MSTQTIYHTIQRYRTLYGHTIRTLPIAIVMPHSACNCRCVMCDIWKGNARATTLREDDIRGLLQAFKRLGTRQVLLSGGEALLHPGLFEFCRLLRQRGLKITLLSTGLLLKKCASSIVSLVDEVIVSLDGDERTHDRIRNIPNAFARLKEGIEALHLLDPLYPVSARSVIHRQNFRCWSEMVNAAHSLNLDRISFLPADVSSTAFNRAEGWAPDRQMQIALEESELPELRFVLDNLYDTHAADFASGFIVERPEKLENILMHYRAVLGLGDYPYRKCNAPWVSAVIEPDGNVRPCFFHPVVGNIREENLDTVLNGPKALAFRKGLNMATNDTCRRCVCSLHLPARTDPAQKTGRS